jgi:hypothetical protein
LKGLRDDFFADSISWDHGNALLLMAILHAREDTRSCLLAVKREARSADFAVVVV